MSFNIGENIGPYRIIEQLGQGGMATVYKAYHAALDRYVALKVLHPAFNQDQTFTARFQREARVVAKLEHSNIVPVYDYSEHEARPYLVMKYIEGDTLKARLNQGPLTSNEIEGVVNSIGSALAYAHRQGILHRDIKPSNVMIALDGLMYLADFGLARIAQAGESTMSSDSIMGTPQYISPEQAMGKKDLDAGTDIYSFGVMLYEMVVGQVPFSADTPFSIIHDHIYTPLPLPMKVNPNVPEPVQRVLLKALAKNRLDRYETVEEMVAAFKDAWTEAGVPMQGTSITMRPGIYKTEPAVVKTQRAEPVKETVAAKGEAKKRSPWKWIGIGVASILCLAVAFFAVIKSTGNPPVEPTAVPTQIPATKIPPTAEVLPTLPGGRTPGGLPTPPLKDSPEVLAAQELVNQNPGDPFAHLKFALALWDAQEFRPAMDELAQSANLAGPNNKEFLLQAAQEFKARDAWVAAAGMYLRLVPIYRNEGMPIELENDFHEAIYKSTEQKDMPLFVFFERIDNASLPLGYIARGRYALYNGDMKEAKTQLANAEKLKPDMYEVFLLKAEIEMKSGSQTEAKNIFLSLSSDLGAPEWIRIMAENYLKAVQ
ncbi:MAG: serine/threonine protein kinase [Anaerolineales bacterium]|nr:serine/threonine protein kinase [Anaerolineales bacterium]